MKERGLICKDDEVRAILDGRKTVMRRPVTSMTGFGRITRVSEGSRGYSVACTDTKGVVHDIAYHEACDRGPFGVPGDRLWVRETWCLQACMVHGDLLPNKAHYRADGYEVRHVDGPEKSPWCSPMHMPRWASRIMLEVVSVRVERLHAITEEDAQREGLSRLSKDGGRVWKYGIPDRDGLPGNDDDGWHWKEWSASARAAFFTLWDKINGDRARSSIDPWVWRVEFRRVA